MNTNQTARCEQPTVPELASMRTLAIRKKNAASFNHLKPVCPVLILHEDFPAYTRAVELYRRVMQRFATLLDFDLQCWNFIELADPNCARHAAKTAGAADIILLSLQSGDLPAELANWLTSRFDRSKADGVLVVLAGSPMETGAPESSLRVRLESFAQRLSLDIIALPDGEDAATVILPPSVMDRVASRT